MDEFCKITEYEEQKDGCIVTFDNGEQLFFSYDEFYKYSLYDKEYGPRMSFDTLMGRVYEDRAYSDGVRESLKSRKTSGEIRTLLKKSYPEEACETAIRLLTEEKYIDDRRYALSFVRKCVNEKLYSRSMIITQGKIKGLPEKDIEYAIGEYGVDDRETAARALERKNREDGTNARSKEELLKKKRKKMSYLASKGFDFTLINELIGTQDDREEEYYD